MSRFQICFGSKEIKKKIRIKKGKVSLKLSVSSRECLDGRRRGEETYEWPHFEKKRKNDY